MAGRPRTYNTVVELETAVEKYFVDQQKPTITGLALSLGFESRQSFYDYEKEDQFSYAVKRARLRIENQYEARLYEQGCTGAIFALKNMGWKDKTEAEVTHSGGVQFIFEKVPSLNGNGKLHEAYETK